VVQWIDFFVRPEYRNILIKAIQHYQKEGGFEIYGYCMMTSHIHLIVRAGENHSLEDITRDLKDIHQRPFVRSWKMKTLIMKAGRAGCYG